MEPQELRGLAEPQELPSHGTEWSDGAEWAERTHRSDWISRGDGAHRANWDALLGRWCRTQGDDKL